MSSSASPEPTEKETGSSTVVDPTNAKVSDQTEASDSDSSRNIFLRSFIMAFVTGVSIVLLNLASGLGGQIEATGQKNESGSFSESQTTMSRTAGYNLHARVIRPAEEVTQPLEYKGFTTTIICSIATAFLSLVTAFLSLLVIRNITHCYLICRAVRICHKEGLLVALETGFRGMKITPILPGDRPPAR